MIVRPLDAADLSTLRAADLLTRQRPPLNLAPATDAEAARILRLERLGLLRWVGEGHDVEGGPDGGCWTITHDGRTVLAQTNPEGAEDVEIRSPARRLRDDARRTVEHLAQAGGPAPVPDTKRERDDAREKDRSLGHRWDLDARVALYLRAAKAAEACDPLSQEAAARVRAQARLAELRRQL